MDFSEIANDTSAQVSEVVEYILRLNISPADKQARITKVLKSVGSYYHDQVYSASSQVLGSDVMSTAGMNDADAQAERLANKIVRNYALTRETSPLIAEYYHTLLGRAQHEAFQNALSLQRHPTLTREVIGETCTWCRLKEGTYTDPSGEDFARHRGCDCLLKVSGYNTRNGLLTNYVKGNEVRIR